MKRHVLTAALVMLGLAFVLVCWSIATAEVASPLLTPCGPVTSDDCGIPMCVCAGHSHSHVNGHSTGRTR